jgi:hypothetical protein
MYDSLVLGNALDLLNNKAVSVNPACPGAIFMLQPGADPGAPQPTTDFVASLLLDGERPFGRRASNRTIKLPVWITAPNRQILAAARELLQSVIDQDYWTMTWTRDPFAGNPGNTPLPLVFDCFRALPSAPSFNSLWEKEICGTHIEITIPALPYGRSDTQVQVSFASPAPTSPTVPPPPTPIVLDTFAAISSTRFSQSSQCVVGPSTACWDPDSFGDFGGQATTLSYGSTFSAPVNLTGMASLQFWFGLGSRYYSNLEYHGKTHGVSFSFTLTDVSGQQLSFSRGNMRLPVSTSAQSPVFTSVTVPIPQGNPAFNYAGVASWSLTALNRQDRIRRLSWVTAYLDNLTALPGSQQVSPVTRGTVYTVYGVQGTARAPVSMSFQQTPTPGTVTTVTAAGPGTYTVPAGTVWLKVEATGGGGAGAGLTAAGVGPGGGGAEYAAVLVFPATAAQVIPYVVGAGDTPGASPAGGQATIFGPAPGGTLQVTANGGGSAATNGTAAGAGGTGSANDVHYPGGPGRANPAGTFGGGGGSSGGDLSAGNTPQGSGSVLFTTAGTFSGGSGWLCPAGVFQVLAECWGAGGGGGSGGSGTNGAGGGGGEYRAALVAVTPGTHYAFTVGAGGAGGTSAGNGSAGGQSSFAGDSLTVTAHAGGGGLDTSSSHSGWGAGGSGGTGATGFSGGNGGSAYPYTGGGGSSAGPAASGNAGTSPGGAPAPAQGGAGGSGSGAGNGTGLAGSAPGGGGGGSYFSAYAGGAGAAGQVRLTYPSGTGAPTSSGAVAVDAGGAGGNGGATAGSAGSAGAAPGGAGGGAFSSGTTLAGGAGANGQLKITSYAPAAARTLIVHRPPLGAVKTFQPLVSVGAGADPPDGTHQYTLPQPVTGVNADFSGTYTVYLINSSWSGGSGSGTTRNIFVTVTQYEYPGGPGYSVSTLPVTVAPNQVTNGILTAGVLTLPVKAVAPDNVGGYYTVSVTDSQTSDRWLDCVFLDTQGQSVVINEPSSGYLSYYIDAPDPNVSLGRIMGSQGGRPNAISVMDNTPYISGGPLFVEPADSDNSLFVYSADGTAPNVSLSYYPAYFFDRTQ